MGEVLGGGAWGMGEGQGRILGEVGPISGSGVGAQPRRVQTLGPLHAVLTDLNTQAQYSNQRAGLSGISPILTLIVGVLCGVPTLLSPAARPGSVAPPWPHALTVSLSLQVHPAPVTHSKVDLPRVPRGGRCRLVCRDGLPFRLAEAERMRLWAVPPPSMSPLFRTKRRPRRGRASRMEMYLVVSAQQAVESSVARPKGGGTLWRAVWPGARAVGPRRGWVLASCPGEAACLVGDTSCAHVGAQGLVSEPCCPPMLNSEGHADGCTSHSRGRTGQLCSQLWPSLSFVDSAGIRALGILFFLLLYFSCLLNK